jgi:hypothetical protein
VDERLETLRWLAGRRAAEQRERLERCDVSVSPARSFEQAAALIDLAARRHGWPLPCDAAAEEEDLKFHLIWAKLRNRLRSR